MRDSYEGIIMMKDKEKFKIQPITNKNREKVKEDFVLTANDLINDRFVLLQSGKKNYFVIRVV